MLTDDINLLNSEQKKNINREAIILLLSYLANSLFITVVFLSLLLFISQRLIKNYFENLNQYSLIIEKANLPYFEEIETINNKMKIVKKLQEEFIPWSNILNNFANIVPPGNTITNASFDKTAQTATFQGVSLNRNDFLKLKENISQSPYFTNVNSPLSNLLLPKDINFNISADFLIPKKADGSL